MKFNDAELIGVPIRVTVGPRGLDNGIVELVERSSGDSSDVSVDGAFDEIVSKLG